MSLTLVSHHLCPYAQRAAISLAEKAVPFDRVYVDLADKPWPSTCRRSARRRCSSTIAPSSRAPILNIRGNAPHLPYPADL